MLSTPPNEVSEIPNDYDVSDLEQENDLIVLTNQITPDELIYNEEIRTTEELIESSRREKELEQGIFTFNVWDFLKKGAINMVLPFINGLMLGFGEILAHEIGFKYGWTGARVIPERRMQAPPSKFL